MDFDNMTNTQLVELHNSLVSEDKALKSWKGKKSVLIERIAPLLGEKALESDVVAPAWTEEDAPEAEVTEVVETTTSTTETGKKITIVGTAISLLCTIDFYEDRNEKASEENIVEQDHPNARSVGLAYDVILNTIHDMFPGSKTSVACLRWYSVKIREEASGYEGLRLPQRRPRVRPNRSK